MHLLMQTMVDTVRALESSGSGGQILIGVTDFSVLLMVRIEIADATGQPLYYSEQVRLR
jgi:hypothetical protein